jgi:3-hydroxyisobutyrate dehydrogenase-like beta-hydroxyacid dehydrogenase
MTDSTLDGAATAGDNTAEQSTPAERIGVIGLGIIGAVWAANYAADGVLAASWNRSLRPGSPKPALSARDVARASSIVHVVVSDPPAVDEVLRAIEPDLGPSHLVIQSTTIDPKSASGFARRVQARGASYVEAPFMGSRPAAEQRKTIFLLGGEHDAARRAEAALGHLSAVRHHVGSEAQAAALKLAFNVHVAITMQGLAESLNLARQSDVSDEAFFRILQGTALWSGFHNLKEAKLRQADFTPQFSVKHMLKDVRLATELARPHSAPIAEAVRERLRIASDQGLSEEDMAALIKLLP